MSLHWDTLFKFRANQLKQYLGESNSEGLSSISKILLYLYFKSLLYRHRDVLGRTKSQSLNQTASIFQDHVLSKQHMTALKNYYINFILVLNATRILGRWISYITYICIPFVTGSIIIITVSI